MSTPNNDVQAQKKKSERYGVTALVLLFLFSLLWRLGAFVIWILLGAITYFTFLFFFYQPRLLKAKFTGFGSASFGTQQSTTAKIRKLLLIIVATVVSIFFALMFIGFLAGDPQQSTTEVSGTESNEAEDQNDVNSVNELTLTGNQLYDQKEYDSALYYYNKILVLDPNNSTAFYNIGLVNYDQQQYDGAFTWFKKAYNAGFRDAFLSHVLAYLYDEKKGNTTQAIFHYKEAVQLDSARADIYSRLAELEPTKAKTYRALEAKWKK